MMIDFLNSSEASGMGRSIVAPKRCDGREFELGRNALVIDDDGTQIAPGRDCWAWLHSGIVPLGYYKDPEKTKATFPVIDGVRACPAITRRSRQTALSRCSGAGRSASTRAAKKASGRSGRGDQDLPACRTPSWWRRTRVSGRR
jgi:hypothetical protein